MNKLPLILIGGGGHCRSCIDVIELEARYSIEGILDKEKVGQQVYGYTILGNDELIDEFAAKKYHFLITVGQIKSAEIRIRIFEQIEKCDAILATVISLKAYVSPNAKLGAGTIVLHGSVINAGASIGANNIINSMSLIEHDVKVGNHVHVSTGAILNGACSVGDKTFIGSGSVIANNIRIGDSIIIGSGSVVINDIMEPGIYAGNPCKKIKG